MAQRQLVKHLQFFIIISIGILCFIEGLSFLALRLSHNTQELFNVRAFSELVPDGRFVTMKKNYDAPAERGSDWRVITNFMGARIPPSFTDTDILSMTPKLLFIGDSVPFGWGLNGEDSVPNLLVHHHPNFIFINGAIPSYSLAQAASRFENEFRDLPNLRYIFLQIYDPVSQYALMGSNWNESDNWTNFPSRIASLDCFGNLVAYKLNFFKLLFIAYSKFIGCDIAKPTTPDSDASVSRHVQYQIKKLRALAPLNAHLIVAPVTPSPGGLQAMNSAYLHALKIVNDALELSCQENDCTFIETRSFLVSESDFIDECCHLSRQGNDKLRARISHILAAQ